MEAFKAQSRDFCRSINRPENFIADSVDLWNATFRMPFFETRQAIKDIARDNLSGVVNAHLAGGVEKVRFRFRPREIYIFVDDDDWIDPGIVNSLNELEWKYSCVVWGSVVIGSAIQNFVTFREVREFCYTNNYAVTSRYFRNPFHKVADVYQHFRATKRLKSMKFLLLPRYLGATNKHPASTLSLERAFGEGMTRKVLVEAVRRYNRRGREMDGLQLEGTPWVRGPLERMRTLFEQVEESVI